MSIVLWNDECEVGVEALDADHIVLFSLINHLNEIIQLEANKKTSHSILKVLINFAIAHFNREEKFLAKLDHPNTQVHAEEHHMIVSKLQSLLVNNEKRDAAYINQKIIEIMTGWATVHVKEWDRQDLSFNR